MSLKSKTKATPIVLPARLYSTTSSKPSEQEDGEEKAETNKKTQIKTIKDTYTEPLSCREDWWRCQLRETPVPGSYEIDDFLSDEAKRPTHLSYNFRSEGRKRDVLSAGRGNMLLPGEFTHKDFLTELNRKKITYSFKSAGRNKRDFTQTKDKDVNVCPSKYPMEKYQSMTVERTPSKHMIFRSQVQRSLYKPTSDIPPVGSYNPPTTVRPRPISSMFRSKTPRFRTAHTKVPGPGTYDETYQSPMPATIARIGRLHGLFFQSQFHV